MNLKHLRYAIFVCCIVAIPTLQAQNYLIRFSGSGMSTILGSVHVTNLTQATTVSLSGVDTLRLYSGIGIDEQQDLRDNGGMNIYPNPANSSCAVEFFNPENGNVVLSIYNMSGQLVTMNEWTLQQGTHTFRAGGLKEGLYLFRITASGKVFNERLITLANSAGTPYVILDRSNPNLLPGAKIKGGKNQVAMQYNPGEILLFRGVSGNYSRIVTLIPTQSQTVDFNFVACTDGNNTHYPVVTIGTQTWMAKNLKATKYNNGTGIPKVTEANAWMNFTTPAYCWYNNDSAAFGDTYGALYKWYVAAAGNLCPTGWHVPTKAESRTLDAFLGHDTLVGGKLKETGLLHWDTINAGATNETGFTGLPGGWRYVVNGNFLDNGLSGYWWSASDYSASFAYCFALNYNNSKLSQVGNNKGSGFSIRCVKD